MTTTTTSMGSWGHAIKHRIAKVSRSAAVGATLALAALLPGLAHAAPKDFYTGGDLSLLPYLESKGLTYTVAGQPESALKTFKNHGNNVVRARLWVNPSKTDAQVNDLAYTVALGQRVKKAGLSFMLDIHYSDTWADPGHQDKPAAWATLTDEQLKAKVRTYTAEVIATMRRAGAMPDIVQIGNETTDGMLWPTGRISVSGWGPFAELLKAGVRGVKDGRGSEAMPKIMIHIDRGGDWGAVQWYYDNLAAQGVEYDIIGLSYYPYYHGGIENAKTVLTNTATRYDKGVMLAETGYPFEGTWTGDWITHPITPAGQRQFLIDLVSHVRNLPQNHGMGVVFWAPEWIWIPGENSSWGWKTLYDDKGGALPGLAGLGGLLDPSRYYRIVNRLTGLPLQVADVASNDGVIAYKLALGQSSQEQWSFVGNADGYFQIKSRRSDKALDSVGLNASGIYAAQSAITGAESQQWDFVDAGAGYFTIVNRQSGKTLDTASAFVDGSWVWPRAASNSAAQQWTIVPAN